MFWTQCHPVLPPHSFFVPPLRFPAHLLLSRLLSWLLFLDGSLFFLSSGACAPRFLEFPGPAPAPVVRGWLPLIRESSRLTRPLGGPSAQSAKGAFLATFFLTRSSQVVTIFLLSSFGLVFVCAPM